MSAALIIRCMIPWLTASHEFPPLSRALREPNGLLAAGGDLRPERIVAAYHKGIFPWFSPGDPILWWSPDPRMVLVPGELKISRSLRRTLRKGEYEVRLDSDFERVISNCSTLPRQGQAGTWITAEMRAAYLRLHRLGVAHSVETWIEGELVGGLYGIALGRVFFGESMFSLRTDASKIALAHLCAYLQAREFGIIDCQMETAHLASLGARPIPRDRFCALLDQFTEKGDPPGPWPVHAVTNCFVTC